MVFKEMVVQNGPQKAVLRVENNTAEMIRLEGKFDSTEGSTNGINFQAGTTREQETSIGMWYLLVDGSSLTGHSGCSIGAKFIPDYETNKVASYFIYISEPDATLTFG